MGDHHILIENTYKAKPWNKVAVYCRKSALVGRLGWFRESTWQDFTVLSFPDIVIMVTEGEVVLNSRPLNYWYPDIEDDPT